MRYLLIPGRHHLVTSAEIAYLKTLLEEFPEAIIVWAVTSADHTGTLRNPLRGSRRLGMIEYVVGVNNLPSMVFMIPNRQYKKDFSHYLIEDIRIQSNGEIVCTPDNTLVICSTEGVIELYEALGFTVKKNELETGAPKPWNVVERIVQTGKEWASDDMVASTIDPACRTYYDRYKMAESIQTVFADPLVSTDDGDITVSRDYATYRASFEDNAWRKVADFVDYVKPGRIVDVGCATGQTIKLLAERPEFFESDFYGVEVARPLYDICRQRQHNSEFGDANVFFYQRNIMQSDLFVENSMSTVLTMALTHEIESYLGRPELEKFLVRAFTMLKKSGVYINYDVVGPDDPDKQVFVRFNHEDGDNPEDLHWELEGSELADFLRTLSSASRFKRFARDFRATEGDQIQSETVIIGDQEYISLRHGDLCDFLAKKDYLNSWKSEMHERFCFFSHEQWQQALRAVGFEIQQGTRAIRNQWLIDNRFAVAADVYERQNDTLVPVEQPVTNTLLIAAKP